MIKVMDRLYRTIVEIHPRPGLFFLVLGVKKLFNRYIFDYNDNNSSGEAIGVKD
jgi:hypothetical protein